MAEQKLIISPKRFRGDSSVVSVRLPDSLVDRLDEIAKQTGRTRNEVIQKCLIYAVDRIEIPE